MAAGVASRTLQRHRPETMLMPYLLLPLPLLLSMTMCQMTQGPVTSERAFQGAPRHNEILYHTLQDHCGPTFYKRCLLKTDLATLCSTSKGWLIINLRLRKRRAASRLRSDSSPHHVIVTGNLAVSRAARGRTARGRASSRISCAVAQVH